MNMYVSSSPFTPSTIIIIIVVIIVVATIFVWLGIRSIHIGRIHLANVHLLEYPHARKHGWDK